MVRPWFYWTMAAVLAGAVLAPTAGAWGRVGHAVIARRAEQELTPAARTQLQPLLQALGVSSIADIASWADERRSRSQSRWHYTNLPANSCDYVAARDCPNGQCLVEVVKQRIAVLADRSNPTPIRANALIDVVHLAGGDSSQPLHAGMREDKGGNTYQVRLGRRGTNLHAAWDSGLIREITHGRGDDEQIERMLAELDRVAPAHRRPPAMSPQAWVEESCQVAHEPGFYPASHVIDDSYIAQARPVLDAQLIQGADELAGALNAALVGRNPLTGRR